MADSRNKGASFERQICKLIKQNLNYDAKRNLDQYQSKGMADIIIPGWSIECKSYKKVARITLDLVGGNKQKKVPQHSS